MLKTGISSRRLGGRRARNTSLRRRVFDILLATAILGALLVVVARFDRVAERSISGQARIADGDSLSLDGERIRLRGIDAPELAQRCEKAGSDYACGTKAREALVALVSGRPVTCIGWERDRYDRLLAACSAGGVELNRQLVLSGWAVAYGDFAAEEASAREAGRGLWSGTFERPQGWRKQHGGMAEDEHLLVGRILNWLRQALRI
jgi:endonuclease YncB( thermonuclease family)